MQDIAKVHQGTYETFLHMSVSACACACKSDRSSICCNVLCRLHSLTISLVGVQFAQSFSHLVTKIYFDLDMHFRWNRCLFTVPLTQL